MHADPTATLETPAATPSASAPATTKAAPKAQASRPRAAASSKPAAVRKPAVAKPASKRKPATAKKAATTPTATPRKPAASRSATAKKSSLSATATSRGAKSAPAGKVEKSIKAKKTKLVRDSFTMPEPEYAQIAALKKRCLKAGVPAKKSEILRAAVASLAALTDKAVLAAIGRLEVIKTGRPAKNAK